VVGAVTAACPSELAGSVASAVQAATRRHDVEAKRARRRVTLSEKCSGRARRDLGAVGIFEALHE
jgi:hypothetical protein